MLFIHYWPAPRMQMAIELFIWGPHRDPSLMLPKDILTVLPSAWHFLCILRLFSGDWHAAAQLAFVVSLSLQRGIGCVRVPIVCPACPAWAIVIADVDLF
jgi:hypothetical protein